MNKHDVQALVMRPGDHAVNDNPYDINSFRTGRAVIAERREKTKARVIAFRQHAKSTHDQPDMRIPVEELFLPAET